MFFKSLTCCLLFVSFQTTAALADALPSQLNVPGFAGCLAQQETGFDLKQLARKYRFGASDLLLPYLAVYPGKRLPGLAGDIQNVGHARWARAWEPLESKLADFIAHLDPARPLTPGDLYREALSYCEPHDIFCAALITHNVLRTLGRHGSAIWQGQDLNPEWFKSHQDFWLTQIPQLASTMVRLRSGPGGERFGEWYHFFGVLVFSIRELGLRHSLSHVRFAAFINKLINPIVLGGPESPEKVQLDRDSVAVAAIYLKQLGTLPFLDDCSQSAAYAATTNNNGTSLTILP